MTISSSFLLRCKTCDILVSILCPEISLLTFCYVKISFFLSCCFGSVHLVFPFAVLLSKCFPLSLFAMCFFIFLFFFTSFRSFFLSFFLHLFLQSFSSFPSPLHPPSPPPARRGTFSFVVRGVEKGIFLFFSPQIRAKWKIERVCLAHFWNYAALNYLLV